VKAIQEVEQGMRKTGYVCGGAAEEVYRRVRVLFLHFDESIGMWHNCVVPSECFWKTA